MYLIHQIAAHHTVRIMVIRSPDQLVKGYQLTQVTKWPDTYGEIEMDEDYAVAVYDRVK